MRILLSVALLLALSGCVRTSVLSLSQDTIEVTASAAPACGEAGAQDVAQTNAAIATIRHGYDRFLIINGGYQDTVRVIGTTPVTSTTNSSGIATISGNTIVGEGTSTTTSSGGFPIFFGHHTQELVVKMFKEDDPAAANAVSAREILGPDWAEQIKSMRHTCT